MTPDEFRRHGHEAIEWIAAFLENPGRYPVLPPVKPGELTDALPAAGPDCGEPMEQIVADFERLVVPAMTHWNHPGFLAYFANSATPEGILGELFAAAWNERRRAFVQRGARFGPFDPCPILGTGRTAPPARREYHGPPRG